MAKKSSPPTSGEAPKKNRWYNNLADSYRIVSRTYKWIPAALIALPILVLAGFIAWGFYSGSPVLWIITGILLAVVVDLTLLSSLLRPAMYSQIDGTVGSVYAVISQIKRGWITNEEPIQVNRDQDLLWRIVGRPGVVLISEGPSSRVKPMMHNERKRIQRITQNAPVVFIECGNDEGQVPLKKLNSRLRSLRRNLTKQEVPAVAMRLDAVGNRGPSIPHGVDPYNTRFSRRSLRG